MILQSLLPFKPVLLPVENRSVPCVLLVEVGTCRFIASLGQLSKVFRYARGMSVEHWMYSDRYGRDESTP